MTSHVRSRRPLPALVRALAGVAALLIPSALAAPTAGAEDPPPQPIASGTVDWGVKQSFRTYIVGGVAQGSIAVEAGAARNDDGTFRFPVASGAFDPATGGTALATAGAVAFTGHHGQLDLRLSDVRVELLGDGAVVRADASSLPLGGTGRVEYPDVALARLDLDAVDPVTVDGTTSWTAVPATLTAEGAPAFGGFYAAGAELDPVTLRYAGPGGKPVAEGLTAPGTPFYDRLERDSAGRAHLFVDARRGILHKLDAEVVNGAALDTLQTVGTALVVPEDQLRNVAATAFDADAGRIFAAYDDGTVSAFTWTGAGYARDELPGAPALGGPIAVSDGRLYLASPASPFVAQDPTIAVVSGEPGDWELDDARPALATNGVGMADLAGLPGGRLVAATAGRIAVGPTGPVLTPSPAYAIVDAGGAFAATAIAGTVPEPAPGRLTRGYTTVAEGPPGSALLGEFSLDPSATRLQWLRADDAGVRADGAPLPVAPHSALAVDPVGGRIHLSHPSDSEDLAESRVAVLERDGRPFASIPGVHSGLLAAGPGDTLFAVSSRAPAPTLRLRLAGASPSVARQPDDASVALADAGARAAVRLEAAAQATPAATVRWQRRAPGATRWADVPGATEPALALEVGLADAGVRFRAVFENAGGRIATRAAALAVSVAPPPVDAEPRPHDPGTPPPGPGTPPGGGAPPAARPLPLPRGAIAPAAGAVRVGPGGVARVALVRCAAAAPCRLSAPRTVRVRVGGRAFRARVLAPARLAPGARGAVRVRLPRPAVRALAGRRATVRLRVVLRASGRGAVRRTATVRLVGLRSARR